MEKSIPEEMVPLFGPCRNNGVCMHAPHAKAEEEKKQEASVSGWLPGCIPYYTVTEKLADLVGRDLAFEIDRIDGFDDAFKALAQAISIFEHYRHLSTYNKEDMHFFRFALAAQVQKMRTLARNFEPGLIAEFDMQMQSISADFSAFFASFLADAFRYLTGA